MGNASQASLLLIIVRCLAFFFGLAALGLFFNLFRLNMDDSDRQMLNGHGQDTDSSWGLYWAVFKGRLISFLVTLVIEAGLLAFLRGQ